LIKNDGRFEFLTASKQKKAHEKKIVDALWKEHGASEKGLGAL
jgi:hypothetical protein